MLTPPYLRKADGSEISESERPQIRSLSSEDTFPLGGMLTITMDSAEEHSFVLMRFGPATHAINLDQRWIPLTATQRNTEFDLEIPADPAQVLPGTYFCLP